MKRNYTDSFAILRERLDLIGNPRPDVLTPPRHDDEEPGPSIFRYIAEQEDLSDLTLPGLYIGRSSLIGISFARSNLRLSTFNWSDFTICDFSSCSLEGADLRGCVFRSCSFRDADMRGSDLRRTALRECDFTGAQMYGARLSRVGWLRRVFGRGARLSGEQRKEVVWCDKGPAPRGG
jgi:uncharacterized protein YjbI with pentapeptide repeats